MASKKDYTRSVLGASEDIVEIFCGLCLKDGTLAMAEGYCVNCTEYFCGNCLKNHRSVAAFENHVLQDSNSMPVPASTALGVCVERCSVHTSKVTEYLCEKCDHIGCEVCMMTDHCECKSVRHIPEIVNHPERFEKFEKLVQSTSKDVEHRLAVNKDRIITKVNTNTTLKNHAIARLKRQRTKINKFFDVLENDVAKRVNDIELRNSATLKAAADLLESMQKEFYQTREGFESKTNEQTCERFIEMHRGLQQMKLLGYQIETTLNDQILQRYTVLPSTQIEAMMRTTTEICKIATAKLESTIDIRTDVDKQTPFIRDIAAAHGHYCVAVDTNNKSLKVIDTKSKSVTSEITLDAVDIGEVTVLHGNLVAMIVMVSSPETRQQVQFFSMSSCGVINLTEEKFNLNKSFCQLVHCKGNLITCNFNEIQIRNMNGNITNTVKFESKGNSFFKYYDGVAVSSDLNTIYMTDNLMNQVTSFTLDGRVKAVYKDKDLNIPRDITVDITGDVYVCSQNANTVHQLSSDLAKVQVLLENVSVSRIAISCSENKLYLTDNRCISVYEL